MVIAFKKGIPNSLIDATSIVTVPTGLYGDKLASAGKQSMDFPFKLSLGHLQMELGLSERGLCLEGAKSHATGLVVNLGDPPTPHKWPA